MQSVIFIGLRRLRAPLIVLVTSYSVSILGLTLIPGMDDQGNPWRMDFFHAFYFVSFMGSTIGFGEIPYPFTGAQRMWTLFSIYATVISWLYAIGMLIRLLQDRAFNAAITRQSFIRQVRRLREPFYLICGYGDTGSQLTGALLEMGRRVVVIEIDEQRLSELALAEETVSIPGLLSDASDSRNLAAAGLTHANCIGVIALTNDDQANLKIALASKLLNPTNMVICRADNRETEDNMASFGTDQIINPFDTFAQHLVMAHRSPGLYLLYDWFSRVSDSPLTAPINPPEGRWVLCGYGRFGKALFNEFHHHGIDTTVIESRPVTTGAPEGTVRGPGTEAITLREAGIESAVGIVAGTDHDANNLSIVMTARELNPRLFMVARQNRSRNEAMFTAANLDLVTHHSRIITGRIMTWLTTPLTHQFLLQASRKDRGWINELISRISGIVDENVPNSWVIHATAKEAPALYEALSRKETVKIHHIAREPHDRKRHMPCLALMLERRDQLHLLPDNDMEIEFGDRLLFAGKYDAAKGMALICSYTHLLSYVMTGRHAVLNPILKKLMNRD